MVGANAGRAVKDLASLRCFDTETHLGRGKVPVCMFVVFVVFLVVILVFQSEFPTPWTYF